MSRFAGVFHSDIPFGSMRDDSITGVLHIASTTDADLPAIHYWVTDKSVLPAAKSS